jgi:hypothetical protein
MTLRTLRLSTGASSVGVMCMLTVNAVYAQGVPVEPAEATVPSEPAEPAEPEAEPVAPPAEGPMESAPTGVVPLEPSEPEAAAPVPEEEPPPAEPESEGFKLKVGVAMRSGLALTFDDPIANGPALALNDGLPNGLNQANQVNIRPLFSGQITDNVGFTFNMEANQSSIAVLDAIVQLKVVDEFQVWFGQHIPAMERNNFNGPFYNNGWNLPIQVQTLPFDIAGRDRGVTFWGLVAGGILKYHASVVDLIQPAAVDDGGTGVGLRGAKLSNARYAGRITLNLLDPENYYYTSGTYYGSQDTLAIGAVYHYQKGVNTVDGEDADNDLSAFAADLLYEQNFNDAGTITFNAGFWSYGGTGANYFNNQGTTNPPGVAGPGYGDQSYLLSASWLSPTKVGYGHIQPNVTVQIGDYAETMTVIDAGIGYIVDGFNHRWHLNYRHLDPGGDADSLDMLQLGVQVQL